MNSKYRVFDSLLEGVQVIDRDFRYFYVNEAVAKQANMRPEDLVGRKMVDKFPGIEETPIFKKITQCMHVLQPAVIENEFTFPDGRTAIFDLRLEPVEEGVIILSFDITEQKKAQERIENFNLELEQKIYKRTRELQRKNEELEKSHLLIEQKARQNELLIRELHHRVKNNLQLVISLINLYSSKINDKHVIEALNECQNNIRALALVHQNLYKTKSYSEVNLSVYLANLCNYYQNLAEMPSMADSVKLEVDLQPITVSIDKAIPLGLIANELLTNAFKHAFKKGDEGKISVELVSKGSEVHFSVKDNGRGKMEDISLAHAKGFGLEMIDTLVGQLEGEFSSHVNGGSLFEVSFKNDFIPLPTPTVW